MRHHGNHKQMFVLPQYFLSTARRYAPAPCYMPTRAEWHHWNFEEGAETGQRGGIWRSIMLGSAIEPTPKTPWDVVGTIEPEKGRLGGVWPAPSPAMEHFDGSATEIQIGVLILYQQTSFKLRTT